MRRWFALLFLLPLAAFADSPIVVMLSWDGMRHDYPDLGEFPALARVEAEGVRAEALVPVYPSFTFPGHVSIATGTWPDTHGIVDNVFIDRERGLYRYESDADWLMAEPIWIAAERQGVPAATYFWVGSESDWRGQGTRYRMAPFDGERPEADKVDQILSWLALPEEERPRLIMSYWAGADSVGHRYGPDAPDIAEQISAQDAQLARLLEGIDALDLWQRTTFIIVSDHGMTETGQFVDVAGALEDAGVAANLIGSTVAHIFLDDIADRDKALDVIASIEEAQLIDESTLAERRLALPQRNGDIIIAAEPPVTFSWPTGVAGLYYRARAMYGGALGSHGYRPELPDMGGIFLAMGRGVRAGTSIGAVHQTDVAATVAALLDIEPPASSEGSPVNLGD